MILIENNYKDLLSELIKKEIKIRYKNSYLGYIWSVANPLALALIFYFVFQIISKMEMENYALFLVTGLFVWQWIMNSMQVGTMQFVGNAGLIKKVNFPRYFIVIALVFSEGFNFIFSLPIIFGFGIYYDIFPSLKVLIGIPLLLIITASFIYGLSLFLATINLFFRDMERIVGLLMTFIFYATPILYPVSMIPDNFSYLLYVNPFTPFVIIWRELLLNNIFDLHFISISLSYAFISVLFGSFFYNKLKYKFAELI
jgi:lipopolysaccharide transport system permease protein